MTWLDATIFIPLTVAVVVGVVLVSAALIAGVTIT